MRGTQQYNGFSLMEIMVALVIFSMISVGAFGVLTNLQRSQAVLDEHSTQLETLQRMILMTNHDISQAAANIQTPDNGQLTFTSFNWPNPLGEARSTMSTVRYELDGDTLSRQLWPTNLSVQYAPALKRAIANHLQALQFRSVIINTSTPAAAAGIQKPPAPSAIEMITSLPPFGEVRQLIPLAQAP